MFVANYTQVIGQSPLPILRLKLSNLDESALAIERDGILDTGADCTLVPFSYISQLQPKSLIRGRDNQFIYGVGRRKIIGVPYRIGMSFNNRNWVKLKIYACPDDDVDGVIIVGRNFLNRYCITFDGRQRRFIID
jgi:hypothetical protein